MMLKVLYWQKYKNKGNDTDEKNIDGSIIGIPVIGFKTKINRINRREYNKKQKQLSKIKKESSEKKDSSETNQSENGLDEFGLPNFNRESKRIGK